MTGYIFQRKRRRDGDDPARAARKSKTWYMRWKGDGAAAKWSAPINLGVRDKQVAQEKCNEFIRRAEREAAGISPPKALRDGASTPLEDQLNEYTADLLSKSKDEKYVENVGLHVRKLLKECGWKIASDITAASFIAWRSKVRKKNGKPLDGKTLNDYLSDMSGLLKWMCELGRLQGNPLDGVKRAKVLRDKSPRRALAPDEVDRLLALESPFHLVYLVTLTTALRRDELKRLFWLDVCLDESPPFIWADASTTKNGKRVTLPLRPDVAEQLRAAKPADAEPGDAVFKRLPTMDEFRADCDAAKIDHKPDARGRHVVFHSLRHTVCTDLSRLGIAPAVAMTVMRHSDLKLTMKRYLDNSLLPIAPAILSLPRRTGGTQGGTQATVQTGQVVSAQVHQQANGDGKKTAETASKTAALSAAVHSSQDYQSSSAGRTRTYNQPVNSRLLYH